MTTSAEVLTERGTVRLSIPATVFVVLLTWVASSLVTYGVVSTRIEWLGQRVENLEKSSADYVLRSEYTSRGADISSRLDRIERKIDALPGR